MSEQTIHSAGDVSLSEIILYNTSSGIVWNITPQVSLINIYESMNDTFIQGDITLIDNQNLTNLFPLTGNELVAFSFKTPGAKDEFAYDKVYAVIEMDEQVNNNRTSVYTLHLISPEAVLDRNIRLSQKYSGSADQVVREVLKSYEYVPIKDSTGTVEFKTKANIEETNNNVCFVSNWWSPVRCIRYIADRALNKNDNPSYVFFENRNGFHFVSLHSMFDFYNEHGPYNTFVLDNSSVNAVEGQHSTSVPNIVEDYSKIISPVRHLSSYKYFDRLQSGFYGSEVVSLDLFSAQYVHQSFSGLENNSRLNKYSSRSDVNYGSTSGLMRCVPKMSYVHNDLEDGTNLKQVMMRSNILSRLSYSGKLVIEVHGRSDYSIGQVVNVKIPKKQQITKDDQSVWDELVSGNYLVYEIKHTIVVGNKINHTCVMNLCKDSYNVDTGNPLLNR